jgi:hypothetical protein
VVVAGHRGGSAPPRGDSGQRVERARRDHLPLVITEMPDGAAWLPLNSPGSAVHERSPSPRARWSRSSGRAVLIELSGPCGVRHDPWWLILIKAAKTFVFLLLTVLVAILPSARSWAACRCATAPTGSAPGLLQSLADGIKLALKEGLTPTVDRPIYLMAPVISVIPAITASR